MVTYGDGVCRPRSRSPSGVPSEPGQARDRDGRSTRRRASASLVIDGDRVVASAEKPQTMKAGSMAGFLSSSRPCFELIESEQDSPRRRPARPAGRNAASLQPINTRGFWQCMDTYREMELLNSLWASQCAPWWVE